MKYFMEKVISWFESYLLVRNFKINIDNKFSDPRNLTSSVPQGSILGRFCFCYTLLTCPRS